MPTIVQVKYLDTSPALLVLRAQYYYCCTLKYLVLNTTSILPGIYYYKYFFFSLFFSHTFIYFPASGQAVDTGVVSSSPRFLPSIFVAHRV